MKQDSFVEMAREEFVKIPGYKQIPMEVFESAAREYHKSKEIDSLQEGDLAKIRGLADGFAAGYVAGRKREEPDRTHRQESAEAPFWTS